jgi:hypothetical protein
MVIAGGSNDKNVSIADIVRIYLEQAEAENITYHRQEQGWAAYSGYRGGLIYIDIASAPRVRDLYQSPMEAGFILDHIERGSKRDRNSSSNAVFGTPPTRGRSGRGAYDVLFHRRCPLLPRRICRACSRHRVLRGRYGLCPSGSAIAPGRYDGFLSGALVQKGDPRRRKPAIVLPLQMPGS